MALQTEITLNPSRFSAGLDYTGPGQAQTTNSLTITTDYVSPGKEGLPGRFVSYSTTSPTECTEFGTGTQVNTVAGVVVNDKFNQNAPANLGGTVYTNQGDVLDVMSLGRVIVQVHGTFDPMGDLYIHNGVDEYAGKLQNSSTDGLLVGGPSYAYGTGNFGLPPVRVVSEEENGLVAVELRF